MRIVTSVALIAALGLSACEAPPRGTPPGKGTSEGHATQISYDCGAGNVLKATYPDARTAVVNYDGQNFTLTLAQSASGSRYVGAGREWWIRAYADREEGTLSPSAGGAAAGGPPIATCRKAPTPGTGAAPSPTPITDWPSTSPMPVASCKSGDLGVRRVSEDAGAGQRHVVYAFVNNARTVCSLKGYATALWLDANGKPLDGVTVIQSEAGGPVSGPPTEIALQPNGRAVFYVSYTGIQATDKACVTSTRLRLTPPGNTQAIEVYDVIAPCTDHITLGPVRADPGDAAL
jgi:membrane-bound inhibitor of C-type lysozyme